MPSFGSLGCLVRRVGWLVGWLVVLPPMNDEQNTYMYAQVICGNRFPECLGVQMLQASTWVVLS